MADTNLKQIAQSVIPDDPEASAYRFIIVAAKRARHAVADIGQFALTAGFPEPAFAAGFEFLDERFGGRAVGARLVRGRIAHISKDFSKSYHASAPWRPHGPNVV